MPRRSKGTYLWLRPERRTDKKKRSHRSTWIIIDRGRQFATGCLATEIAKAEQKLAEHVAAKYQPRRKERDIESIDVADVLWIYYEDTIERQGQPDKFEGRIGRLNEFWGGKVLADVTGETCRDYARQQGSPGGARRDLEDLRAAINHHSKEGLHRGIVRVTLPDRGKARDRWLTRQEVARLVWSCWRYKETQVVHRGQRSGQAQETSKAPLRHIARFLLIGAYSGTRSGAVLSASPHPGPGRSYVDIERGIFYRLAEGARETNKRQPPVPLPPRLLAHMRRWVRLGIVDDYFIEWQGKPVASVKTGFSSAMRLAGIAGKVTPHTLRHTAATWLMQAGVDKWEAAGFLGMSVEMLDRVYGHHHPGHLRNAAHALGYRPREKLAVSLAPPRRAQRAPSQVLENIGRPGRTRTSNQTVMSGPTRCFTGLSTVQVTLAQLRFAVEPPAVEGKPPQRRLEPQLPVPIQPRHIE